MPVVHLVQSSELPTVVINLAYVAGARKGKGEGKIGRARNTRTAPPLPPDSPPRVRALDFFSPFPFLAPATQAIINPVKI